VALLATNADIGPKPHNLPNVTSAGVHLSQLHHIPQADFHHPILRSSGPSGAPNAIDLVPKGQGRLASRLRKMSVA